MSWVLPDEVEKILSASLRFVTASGAVVPAIWHLEVAHALLRAERRRRISEAERVRALVFLSKLKIESDRETSSRAWGDTLVLAERHGLTPYDASYLELALRLALPLSTRDGDLTRAAAASGVRVFD